jgi:sulfite reductase beta subunit-like hemoprotein
MSEVAEKTKIERLKEDSQGLRGSLREEIVSETPKFSIDGEHLLKFHGIYQQKDRDRRKPGEVSEGPKPFTLMVRGRIPGGRLNWKQWLAWDQIADRYSTHGLRLTTRQSLQLHGVLKKNLKSAVQDIHQALSSTTGACGDVVRNVTQAVNPWGDPKLDQLNAVADLISKHFEVESNAYFEIFLDGQAIVEEKIDRIYGTAYLPRKFKIGITAVGNNSIDIYTQDLGLAATYDDHGQLDGYFVFVGGGMGMSHSDAETHPRLADNLGWIPAVALIPVTEGVVTTQRDFGNRENRTFARLKYLLDKKGVEWFRTEVEQRSGFHFEAKTLPAWKTPPYLGWSQHRDGSLSLGFHTLSGRLVDTDKRKLKTTLRELIQQYELDVQVTADQDLVLLGIPPVAKRAIEAFLDSRGLSPDSPRKLYDRALTCVALPTCVKALAEGERAGPEIFGWLQESLDRYDLNDRAPVIRITGCPNGCARPFTAEIGLVGQLPGHYAVFVGGDAEGLRLAHKIRDKVKVDTLPEVFDKLTQVWASEGLAKERFGDFAVRIGFEKLGALL